MRVVIADDAVLVRSGIAALLRKNGVEVLAEVANAIDLLASVARDSPRRRHRRHPHAPTHTDEGVRAAQRIRRESPHVGVLLLSQYVDVSLALRLLDSNERSTGYLLKERVTDEAELVEALHRVAAGGTVIDPGLVEDLVAEQPVRAGWRRSRPASGPCSSSSPRGSRTAPSRTSCCSA